MARTNSSTSKNEKPASEQIDAIIKFHKNWKGEKLATLRDLIKKADPDVVEEVKWKKPSNPRGVPVWSHHGIICIANVLKNSVRLTFSKGIHIKDPKRLFNSRLDSKGVRAIDFYQEEVIDKKAFDSLIKTAVKVNVLNKK